MLPIIRQSHGLSLSRSAWILVAAFVFTGHLARRTTRRWMCQPHAVIPFHSVPVLVLHPPDISPSSLPILGATRMHAYSYPHFTHRILSMPDKARGDGREDGSVVPEAASKVLDVARHG
uniref:Uncharacterized protein n=1 Tax=Craspedostauros australis TaxID=1486917 RepID=A0A7S0F509_9STRA